MPFVFSARRVLRLGGMLLACAVLALISVVPWQSTAVAGTLVTQTPVPTAPHSADWDQISNTSTMTDTMQLVLNAYVDATTGDHLVPSSLPVELASPWTVMFLPYVVQSSATTPSLSQPIDAAAVTKSGADIAVTLWPSPSIRAARNGIVAYELRVKNYDQGSADKIKVTLPFNARHLSLVNAVLDADKGDWVSEATSKSVTVTFGSIGARATRVGTLIFRIKDSLANDTVLDMRARYNWHDGRGDHGDFLSNWAPVLVGSSNDSAPWVWLKLDPTNGAAKAKRVVVSNRYAPNEDVVTWLNTPSGVRSFNARGTTDRLGNLSLHFTGAGLARGTYQLVVYGTRSALTGVATFTVN